MNIHELIFSNERSFRIRRHLLFWTAWCTYYIITFMIPTHWIPAWNLDSPRPHIEKYGAGLAVVRILLSAVLIVTVHAILVYGILYFILRRYLSKTRNWVFTSALLLLFVCSIAFINYFNFVFSLWISTRKGYFTAMPEFEFIAPGMDQAYTDQLSHYHRSCLVHKIAQKLVYQTAGNGATNTGKDQCRTAIVKSTGTSTFFVQYT